MYTSGWAKNQNMCCHSRWSPPSAWLKKCVPTSRSSARQLDAIITDGIAKMIMKATTRNAQTMSGMRVIDMPGARCLKIVTTRFTAVASADSSVKVIICAQTSTRLPGEKAGPDSGV